MDELKTQIDEQVAETLKKVREAEVGSDEAKARLEQLNAELKARQQLLDAELSVKKDKRERRKTVADVCTSVLSIVVPAGITLGLAGVAVTRDTAEGPVTWRNFWETVTKPLSIFRKH